ncbi:MAG: SLC13 family permease [Betaproteobacteria bacterium]|nr:SLC13 family permease [Betaproteobacteria bacterium]
MNTVATDARVAHPAAGRHGSITKPSAALWRSSVGLALAFLLLFAIAFGPSVPGLQPVGQKVLGVFAWFVVCMVADALPMAVVGLTSPLLLVIVAHMKVPDAFNAFNKDIFFLATGAFILAAVMMGTPLGKRIAFVIAAATRSSSVTRILLGLTAAQLVTHPVIPVVNETALFLPVCKGVGSCMEGKEHLPEARRINTAILYLIAGLMPLFIGPLILTSHFPNLILAAYLKSAQHIDISWGQWLWLNLPLWGLLPIVFVYVVRYFGLTGLQLPGAEIGLARMRDDLGKITWPELWALGCLAIAMVLWIGGWLQPGMTALLAGFLMLLPWSGIRFGELNRHMLWDVLMLLGGAISLSTALYKSGVVSWLAHFVAAPIQSAHLPLLVVLVLLVFAFHVPRAGIVSAVAAGAAFVPLVAGIAQALHYSVLPFTLVVINSLSYAFFLPISITAFLIAWGASGTSTWEAIKFGAPLSIIANLYVILVQPVWLRMIGFPM